MPNIMRVTTLALLLFAVACSDSASPSSPSKPASGHGTFTATIDGVPYTGTIGSATLTNGLLNISSSSADLTRYLSFAVNPAAVGTISAASAGVQMNVITMSGASTTGSWLASLGFGSGTLTINTLTSSGATGTISFTAVPVNQSTPAGNKVVTSGMFNATF